MHTTVKAFGIPALLQRLRYLVTGRDLLTEVEARGRPRSVFLRHVDGGSSNDCELEIAALFNAVYDAERFGFHLVASPRHADVLLVSGPLTRSMEAALLAAFQAMPKPCRVVTVGDGFCDNGPFAGSYAVVPLPAELHPAWQAHVLGDPPSPQAILRVLLALKPR
jgi:Ni,Fe-hydrogenase III small subunit